MPRTQARMRPSHEFVHEALRTRTDFPKPDLERGAAGAAVGASASISIPNAAPAPNFGAINADLLYLLRRATNGFTVADYQEAQTRGYQGWLDWQLDHQNVDDAEVDTALAQYQTLDLTNKQLYETYINDPGAVVFELQQAVLLRGIYSQKQLYERMVEFWTDHFNINQLDDFALWFKTSDDRRVIRQHALGNFPDMLRTSARSAAMLWYLDNYANTAGSVQENWARELQELHTLGVNGPYTEQDVVEVARCFTGWTFHGVFTNGPFGKFTYVDAVHDQGAKVVLGQNIPAGGGMSDGEFVLDLLAMHPSTAEFISTKMARWLLAYEPPASLVQRLTNIYLSTGGEIKPMVKEILQPHNRERVAPGQRRKFRRPWHLVTSLMRATAIQSANLLSLTTELQTQSMVPYWWGTPDGYPDRVDIWGRNLLPRWDFASRLLGRDIAGNEPVLGDLQALLATAPMGSTQAEAISWILTGGTLLQRDVDDVQAFLDSQPSVTGTVLREAIALAASSPSFQYF